MQEDGATSSNGIWVAIYDKSHQRFYAMTGWTRQPSAVWRFKQPRAEEILKRLNDPNASIVPYKTVFEVLGTPGNNPPRPSVSDHRAES